MTEEKQAVQDQILDNHETRIRQLEVKFDETTRSVVKLEVIIEHLNKRWDSLEARLFELMNQANNTTEKNTQEWSNVTKEIIKVVLILAGAIASVKFFGN